MFEHTCHIPLNELLSFEVKAPQICSFFLPSLILKLRKTSEFLRDSTLIQFLHLGFSKCSIRGERKKGCIEMETPGLHSHFAGTEILTSGQVIITPKEFETISIL